MKHNLIFCLFTVFLTIHAYSQQYSVDVKIKNYNDSVAYLGFYRGENQIIIDTAKLKNRGVLNFNGATKFAGGIYFIKLNNGRFFNFIIDGIKENFILKTQLSDLQNKLKVAGCKENKIYQQYLKKKSSLKNLYEENSKAFNQKLEEFINFTEEKNPGLFVTKYLKMVFYNYQNMQDHFSSIDFTDHRILQTDVYFNKIDSYLSTYAVTDEVKMLNAIALLIDKSEVNKEVFKNTCDYVFDKYKSKNEDAEKKVFIAMARFYYLSGKADWISPSYKQEINTMADNAMFELAKKYLNVDIFINYLKDFPEAIHKAEAHSIIENLKFENAKKMHTLESYRAYLNEYPNGKFKTLAETAIAQLQTSLSNVAKVNWLTIEEAIKKQQKEPRKIFVDIYTDWCGWCKVMDNNTFSQPVIINYLNEKYYAVKFNAEQKDDVVFQGKKYTNQNPTANRHSHDLAVALLQGKMGYPSVVFIDEKSNVITSISGYQKPEGLEPILMFFYTDSHLTTKWEDFQKTFKSEIK